MPGMNNIKIIKSKIQRVRVKVHGIYASILSLKFSNPNLGYLGNTTYYIQAKHCLLDNLCNNKKINHDLNNARILKVKSAEDGLWTIIYIFGF